MTFLHRKADRLLALLSSGADASSKYETRLRAMRRFRRTFAPAKHLPCLREILHSAETPPSVLPFILSILLVIGDDASLDILAGAALSPRLPVLISRRALKHVFLLNANRGGMIVQSKPAWLRPLASVTDDDVAEAYDMSAGIDDAFLIRLCTDDVEVEEEAEQAI